MNNQTTTPEAVFKEMGLRYVGRQAMGRGRADGYMFDALDNSTLLMDGPVTVESVNAKLAEHEEIWRNFKRSVADEELCAAVQAHEDKFR